MDNSELIRYLRENRKSFTIDQLRAGLLEQGVDAAELEAAIRETASSKPRRRVWLGAAVGGGVVILLLLARRGSRPPSRADAPAAPAASASPARVPSGPDGGLEAAREEYRRDYFDPYAHVALAEALYRSGRAIDSFYVLEQARGMFPKRDFELAHVFVVTGKGTGGWGQGRFDPSPEHEARLVERMKSAPMDWEARGYLAHIEGGRGDYDAALAHVNAALDLAPAEPRLLAYKAFLDVRKNNLDEAFVLFDKVAELAPDSPDGRSAIEFIGRLALAKDSKKLGDLPKAAMISLRGIVKDHPDDGPSFTALAFARWARGDMAAVNDSVQRTLARNPNHAGAAAVAGALAIEAKQPDAAIRWLKKALAADPDDEYALERLATLHLREKRDIEGALPYYIALHHLNPDYNDGEYAEARIKEWLEQRRDSLLSGVQTPSQLSAFFASDDGSLRAEACLRAAKFHDARLIEPLINLLDDDVGNVVQNADYALYQIEKAGPGALSSYRDRMLNSPRPFIRGMALNTFCDLAPKETLPVALERLKDPEAYVRFRAFVTLKHYYPGDADVQRALDAYRSGEKDRKLMAALQSADQAAAEKDLQAREGEKLLAPGAGEDPAIGSALKAALLLEARDYPAAVKEYKRALVLSENAKNPAKTDLGMIYSGLGDACLFSGRSAEAVPALERASKVLTGPVRIHVLYNLACAYSVERRLKAADRALRACLSAARKERQLNHFVAAAKADPQLANLRRDRGFAKLLASFGK